MTSDRTTTQGVCPDRAFDLAGAFIGKVPLDRIVIGQDVQPGDARLRLASSGIPSNGLSPARRVFFGEAGWTVDRYMPDFGPTLGDELHLQWPRRTERPSQQGE